MKKAPIVTCPTCGKEHMWHHSNRFRPFCSERCKLIDLGKWASEAYRIELNEGAPSDQKTHA